MLNNKIVDLHCHSYYSDGSHSPSDVVEHAFKNNIGLLALTDHDQTGGIPEAKAKADELGIKLVSGIEISTPRKIHIVGLCINPETPEIQNIVVKHREERDSQCDAIGRRLAELGYPGVIESIYADVKALGITSTINKNTIAKKVGQMYFNGNSDGLYVKFFKSEPKQVETPQLDYVTIEEAVPAILKAGGIPILAHSWLYFSTSAKTNAEYFPKFVELVERFKKAGGIGIELDGPTILRTSQELMERKAFIEAKALELGLYGSCGSDFHDKGSKKNFFGNKYTFDERIPPVWTHPKFKVLE